MNIMDHNRDQIINPHLIININIIIMKELHKMLLLVMWMKDKKWIIKNMLENRHRDTYGEAHSPLSLASDCRFHVKLSPPNGKIARAQDTTR